MMTPGNSTGENSEADRSPYSVGRQGTHCTGAGRRSFSWLPRLAAGILVGLLWVILPMVVGLELGHFIWSTVCQQDWSHPLLRILEVPAPLTFFSFPIWSLILAVRGFHSIWSANGFANASQLFWRNRVRNLVYFTLACLAWLINSASGILAA